eukprot:15479902-Alexandrium_andersonii.AAC.1
MGTAKWPPARAAAPRWAQPRSRPGSACSPMPMWSCSGRRLAARTSAESTRSSESRPRRKSSRLWATWETCRWPSAFSAGALVSAG